MAKLKVYRAAYLLAAAAAWAVTSATILAQAPPVDIAGKWQLNVAASTNPNGAPAAPPAAPRAGSARGGSSRGGGGDSGGGSGGSGGGGGDEGGGGGGKAGSGPPPGGSLGAEEMARINNARKLFEQAPPVLTIQAAAKEVTLTYNDGKPVFNYKIDEKVVMGNAAAGKMEVKAKWDGKTLKREITTSDSLKITEVYSLSPDGKQLIVTVKPESNMTKIIDPKIKRVYDKVQ